jgi:hypothetical protein
MGKKESMCVFAPPAPPQFPEAPCQQPRSTMQFPWPPHTLLACLLCPWPFGAIVPALLPYTPYPPYPFYTSTPPTLSTPLTPSTTNQPTPVPFPFPILLSSIFLHISHGRRRSSNPGFWIQVPTLWPLSYTANSILGICGMTASA